MRSQALDELLSQEMSRKQFVMQVGSAVMVMFGVSGLLKALLQMKNPTHHVQNGYGISAYGGLKR